MRTVWHTHTHISDIQYSAGRVGAAAAATIRRCCCCIRVRIPRRVLPLPPRKRRRNNSDARFGDAQRSKRQAPKPRCTRAHAKLCHPAVASAALGKYETRNVSVRCAFSLVAACLPLPPSAICLALCCKDCVLHIHLVQLRIGETECKITC